MLSKYHCPYCDAWIEHRLEFAGDQVSCSKCGGEYFEPTDLLPGERPQKVPPASMSELAAHDLVASQNPSASQTPTATSNDPDSLLQNLDPFHFVMEMKRRGSQAVMITQSPNDPSSTSIAYSDNLTPEQASDIVLRMAVRVMETRWPDVYQLVANRI